MTFIIRDEANEILKIGYPNEENLQRFPLGDILLSISDVDPRYNDHIHKVIEGINILLSEHPENIVESWKGVNPVEFIELSSAINKIYNNENDNERLWKFKKELFGKILRIFCLYHDIGKSIITERHPHVGWHILNDVYHDRLIKEVYPMILGIDYREWENELKNNRYDIEVIADEEQKRLLSLFKKMMLYHDLFGTMVTGESSLPIILDLIDMRGTTPQEAKELFSVLMIINLADIYGTITTELKPKIVKNICLDWKKLCDLISNQEVHGDRKLFFLKLIDEARRPEVTIERLYRLMYANAPDEWQEQITIKLVEDVFRDITISGRYTFMKNFALFCKLDYFLSFKKILMLKAKENNNTNLRCSIKILLTLLSEYEKRYGDLTERKDGSLRRIGIELAGLTRKPATHKDANKRKESKIGDTISDLILNPEGLGWEWAISESSMWFLEE